jgi:hypothetical protein
MREKNKKAPPTPRFSKICLGRMAYPFPTSSPRSSAERNNITHSSNFPKTMFHKLRDDRHSHGRHHGHLRQRHIGCSAFSFGDVHGWENTVGTASISVNDCASGALVRRGRFGRSQGCWEACRSEQKAVAASKTIAFRLVFIWFSSKH